MQVLELAGAAGVLEVEDISVDGTKIHADASKSKAVSHKRLEEKQDQLRIEVEELLQMGQQADTTKAQGNIDVAAEIDHRNKKLANLAEAKEELQHRVQERFEVEQTKYNEKMSERNAYTERTGRKPRGKVPVPPF